MHETSNQFNGCDYRRLSIYRLMRNMRSFCIFSGEMKSLKQHKRKYEVSEAVINRDLYWS